GLSDRWGAGAAGAPRATPGRTVEAEVQRRSEQNDLGGHVTVDVEAADQRQRWALEDSLDDRPDLVLDHLVEQEPVGAQPFVLSNARQESPRGGPRGPEGRTPGP